MTPDALKSRVSKYAWYHTLDLGNGIITPGSPFNHIWDFIKKNLQRVDFTNRSVIDIGCRDGMFSLLAEKAGAQSVYGVDNDISAGAVELVLPHFNSKVIMEELSVYNLLPAKHGMFDITMMFGLIYHLRYPFNGLRAAVNVTKPEGLVLIETGIFTGAPQDLPMLYCPFKDSPYEPGSISFFNPTGLITAMDSFGCSPEWEDQLAGSDAKNVRRGFFAFRKTHDTPDYLKRYWNGAHREHSENHPR